MNTLVFLWGCEEELVPVDVAGALKMVKPLQKGRTSAKVYEPVTLVLILMNLMP